MRISQLSLHHCRSAYSPVDSDGDVFAVDCGCDELNGGITCSFTFNRLKALAKTSSRMLTGQVFICAYEGGCVKWSGSDARPTCWWFYALVVLRGGGSTRWWFYALVVPRAGVFLLAA